MAGSLTIGGKTEGPTGQTSIGPITITGTNVISQVDTIELAPGDNTVAVPSGKVAVVIAFTAVYEGPEVRLRSNVNPSDAGFPLAGEGFVVLPLTAATTSLILHVASATTVGVTFI